MRHSVLLLAPAFATACRRNRHGRDAAARRPTSRSPSTGRSSPQAGVLVIFQRPDGTATEIDDDGVRGVPSSPTAPMSRSSARADAPRRGAHRRRDRRHEGRRPPGARQARRRQGRRLRRPRQGADARHRHGQDHGASAAPEPRAPARSWRSPSAAPAIPTSASTSSTAPASRSSSARPTPRTSTSASVCPTRSPRRSPRRTPAQHHRERRAEARLRRLLLHHRPEARRSGARERGHPRARRAASMSCSSRRAAATTRRRSSQPATRLAGHPQCPSTRAPAGSPP